MTTTTSTGNVNAAPLPTSPLSLYRLLSPTAAVRVSPLCLGSMNFGTAWKARLGECSKTTAFDMLDEFHAHGGNLIDTANTYQGGESEQWLGEWMELRGVREEMVVATKYTGSWDSRVGHLHVVEGSEHKGALKKHIAINTVGNSTKSLAASLRSSLERLRTDYVDIMYVHFWDYTASIEEVMTGLNALVQQGKVLYLGVSDTPAWIVVKANAFARQHGMRPFSVYQGHWSAASRDLEREILPMCADEGMGVCPFGALGSGAFKTTQQRADAVSGRSSRTIDEKEEKICQVLEKVAMRHEAPMTSVALAYILTKYSHVTPIIGGRSIDHLRANIRALDLGLTAEDVAEIEEAVPFDVGFPYAQFGGASLHKAPGVGKWLAAAGHVAYAEPVSPIKSVTRT